MEPVQSSWSHSQGLPPVAALIGMSELWSEVQMQAHFAIVPPGAYGTWQLGSPGTPGPGPRGGAVWEGDPHASAALLTPA